MRTLARSAVSILLLSIIAPRFALASCILQTEEQQLNNAEVVVKAVVTEVDIEERQTTITASVLEKIKGDTSDTITFVTESGSRQFTSVDVSFEEQATYKIFLYRNSEGELTTNSCTGTRRIDASTESTPDSVEKEDFHYNILIVAGMTAAVILTASALVMRRSMQKKP